MIPTKIQSTAHQPTDGVILADQFNNTQTVSLYILQRSIPAELL